MLELFASINAIGSNVWLGMSGAPALHRALVPPKMELWSEVEGK